MPVLSHSPRPRVSITIPRPLPSPIRAPLPTLVVSVHERLSDLPSPPTSLIQVRDRHVAAYSQPIQILAQGHVIPMLEFSRWLAKHGIKVTFVNTEFNHKRILKSLSESDNIREVLTMVSIPDGMEPWEDRRDLAKITEAIFRVPPVKLESLIVKINEEEGGDKITCVIADATMAWALEVAEKLGIRRAAFWTAAAAVLAVSLNIPKLISDGIMDGDGPLLATNRLGKSAGYFWSEDSACLAWLDQQPTNSVIYAAFGSCTTFDQAQFEEVALGLELTNRPFMWVVRQDMIADVDYAYPKGFKRQSAQQRANCKLGSSATSFISSLCRLLHKPLRLEFYHRGRCQWSPFHMLALFCGSVKLTRHTFVMSGRLDYDYAKMKVESSEKRK
ncbi:hypothetical protein DH2020_009271 [Rehmannia glutinosa]|uniref:UDP-glycosyltransferase n=1 Tax=Rehmannia glutinosa TaxID=99300 RepID=A0ABR0X5T8_REHGL